MKKLFTFWRLPIARAALRGKLFSIFALVSFGAAGESIVNTVHNLSVNGPGTIKAATEKNACIFCHTVHHASGVTPLWNHSLSSVSNYVVYSSQRLSDMNLTIPQPNGASRLCLSCHDGTVALGSVSSGAPQIPMQNSVTTLPVGDATILGTDLSKDHPISFVYDSALAAKDLDVNDPAHLSTKAVRMDSQNRLQCTACHDPHNNQFGNFLVMANDPDQSQLCLVCHKANAWGTSAHAVSSQAAPAALLAKIAPRNKTLHPKGNAATIGMMGCASCHMSHSAGSKTHLLEAAVPEENCYVCHNGVTTKKNIAADFQKLSIHPITLNSSSHSPTEDPINPPSRHVVCADCHDSHAANITTAIAPKVSGALANVTGVTAAGGIIKPALKQYELCFRCHADSLARGPAIVSRQVSQTNLRLAFSTANQSFHPIETIGKNQTSVPSLVAPWTVSSVMYCTDCHNSDSGPNAGGSGANGPHGSIFSPILERNLVTTDGQPESAGNYALCYKCHDRNRVLSPLSFRFHESHVVNDKAACTTCHDSHGAANAPHLINFNTMYVTNGSLGMVQYISTGNFKGTCTLSCHGVDHKNKSY
jgi:predicted CXXCH cytochrome family protein